MLIVKGKIAGIKEKKFEDKVTKTAQFTDFVGGTVVLTEVKLLDDTTVKVGDEVTLNVAVSTYNNSIYIKQV